MPRLIIHKRAARYLGTMDARIRGQLLDKLVSLAAAPATMPGVKPMSGESRGYFRLRHGDWRVIYLWDQVADAVIIAHVGPREDIYK